MSFHIDIIPYRPKLGSPELDPTSPLYEEDWVTGFGMQVDENGQFISVLEIDYSLNECVQKGWYDPATDTWTRDTIEAPDDYHEYSMLPCPDRRFGQKLGLRVELIDGRYWHKAGFDLLMG